DAFADLLRGEGVNVLYVEQLLSEVLADPALREEIIVTNVDERSTGPVVLERVRDYLRSLSPHDLSQALFAGVTVGEAGAREGLVATVTANHKMLLQPLPNAVFMRDSSAFVGEGVVLSPMSRVVRRRETDLLRVVYANHSTFAGVPVWFGRAPGLQHWPSTFEGGDILVVGDRGIAVGMSERSTPAGVEALATTLFEAGVVDRVLAVDLPKARAAMHLDTIVTMVDVDTFITYPEMTRHLEAWCLDDLGGGKIKVSQTKDLTTGLAWAAGLDAVRAIEPDLSSTRAAREQWNDANNTLAISPGNVVAYERNVATNEILREAGITVHTIPSYELPRGRGGPRCMSLPVQRAPL
ncbi:MAG: arginine deiminase, partial [Glaciecola sp.]